MVRTAIKRMLERIGFTVRAEQNGAAGLKALEELREQVRFVLLDLTMPRMSGDEVFRAMRRARPGLPVVLMTGFSAPDAVMRFKGQGLAAFLQKPFCLAELERCLERALRTTAATTASGTTTETAN